MGQFGQSRRPAPSRNNVTNYNAKLSAIISLRAVLEDHRVGLPPPARKLPADIFFDTSRDTILNTNQIKCFSPSLRFISAVFLILVMLLAIDRCCNVYCYFSPFYLIYIIYYYSIQPPTTTYHHLPRTTTTYHHLPPPPTTTYYHHRPPPTTTYYHHLPPTTTYHQ